MPPSKQIALPPPVEPAEPAALARNRQQERSDRSTRRLLEAAGELIVERGYVGMTLAAVGERAGYSRGLVTMRFGSKANLLDALVERITTGWSHRNLLPATEGKSGLDGFLALISAIQRQFERDPHNIRVLYALMFEALGPNEELRAAFVEFHRRQRSDMATILRRGIGDGSIKPSTVVAAEATAIVTGLRGIAYQWLLDPDGFDPGAALRHLRESTEQRLTTKRGRART
jgi:AcrR family transcriptional regulator